MTVAIPNPPRKSIKGLEIAFTETAFILYLNNLSFSAANLLLSYFSMPNALTMRVPEMVSCKREFKVPMVICVEVVTLLIFLPNMAIG